MIRTLISVLLFTTAAFAAEPLTVDDYVRMPTLGDVHFSPDGERIAYVIMRPNFTRAAYDGEIHVINSDGSDDITLTHSTGSDYHPRWSPEGKRIAFLSDRGGKVAIYVINIDGGEAAAVTEEPTAVRDFEWSPDGRTIVFVRGDETKDESEVHVAGANKRRDRLYAIDTGSRKVVPLTDGTYTAGSFAISPDGKSVVFERANSNGLDELYRTDLYLIDINGGEPRALVTRPGADRSPVFSPDGKSVAFLSTGGTQDWLRENELYVVSVADQTSRLVSGAYGRAPEDVVWSHDSKSIYFSGPWNTTSELFRVGADGTGFSNMTNVAGLADSADVDSKRDRMAFVQQSLTEPPELYVSALSHFAPKRVTKVNAAYRDRALGSTRIVRWKNPKDGLEIEGLLTLPLGYTAGQKVPLLTFVHGGPASRFDQGFLGYLAYIYPVHVLASKGFAVLRPNPRGTGGYGQKFREANRSDWGGMDWIDINAGIDKVIADGIADPARLGIMGWSYGGFMTAWAAGHSERFKAISIGAPVVDLLSFHGTTDIRDFIPSYFPRPSLELLRERSPLWHLRPTKTPILIQHGESDDRVPLSQGTMLYRVLDELGANVTMVTYPRTPHTPREPKLRLDAGSRNVEFMEKYVK